MPGENIMMTATTVTSVRAKPVREIELGGGGLNQYPGQRFAMCVSTVQRSSQLAKHRNVSV